MVEQRTENPRVPSSILGLGTSASNYLAQPINPLPAALVSVNQKDSALSVLSEKCPDIHSRAGSTDS